MADIVNASLNATLNQTSVLKEVGEGIGYLFRDLFWPRFLQILEAPIKHPNMLWMVVPLLTTMVLMMFYFSRFKKEELGWNTAIGNSLVLIFIGIDLLRTLSLSGDLKLASLASLTANIKILVALGIIAEGFLIMWVSFVHGLPKRFVFFIASPIYVNLTAYLGLVIIYSDVSIDLVTLMSATILFVILSFLFLVMRKVIPESAKEIEESLDEERRGLFGRRKQMAMRRKSSRDAEKGDSDWVELKEEKKEKQEKRNDEDSGLLSGLKR